MEPYEVAKIVFSAILIVAIPYFLRVLMRSRKEIVTENEIKWSATMKLIGLGSLIFWLIIMPFALIVIPSADGLHWWETLALCYIFFLPTFGTLGLYLYLLGGFKVIVYSDRVEYVNIFGQRKVYEFNKYTVKKYSATYRVVKQYKNKKGRVRYKILINISFFCINCDIAYKAYRKYAKENKKVFVAKN